MQRMGPKTDLPPHPIPAEAEAYLAAMTPAQRELHELAVKMLGSSYFIQRTHGYRKWLAAAGAKQRT